ncbi:unnamed protein product [Closterium sp. NIES-65]|nr:unnamed protein product [Closterium sp. NIES-65]
MEWLTSAEGLNARQELEASVREHHPHLRDEEVDLIVDGRLLRMVRERAAEQATASSQQGGTGKGGAVHEAPSAVGIGGGALAPTIDTGMICTSYGQFKFGVEHISVTPLLEGRHDLTAKGDDETAESYCNRARTIRAELLTIGQEVHMATFAAHVLKGLPPEYGFLRRKLEISSPDMTVERVCSEVLMEEQTLSMEQSYKQITSDASAFSGAVNTIVATTGVNGKEGKEGREHTDKKKDGKREKKRAPFKGRCYNCNEEGHMAAKCPNKKKDTTPAAAANVAEGDGKGVALSVACSAAKLLADDKDLWFLDSGCSQHMTGRKEWFTVIRDPSATKSVKGFDGSMQEVAGVGEVLLEGTNSLRVTLYDVLFVPGMKANLVSPGQLLDKGANLQTEEGVTRIIASGGQVAATARYRHRLHYLDLKPGPARNGATAVVACNGMAAAAACTDMVGGAASNGTGAASACNGTAVATASNGTAKEIADVASSKPEAKDGAASLKTYAVGSKAMPNLWHARLGHVHFDAVKRTATSGGVFGMDLEKGGEDMPCTSCHEAKLTRESFPLHDEREEQNPPPPRTVIVAPVPSVQGGEKPLERSVGPLGSKAPTAPPPFGPPSVADSAPVGPADGPVEVDTSKADHEKEEEEEVAVDEQSPMAHEHEPSPAVPPFQPIPPPPRRSSRPNKGVPPVRFQPSAMTALDADDEDNPYDVAYLAGDECDTGSDDDVEYPDKDEEEEGAWGGVILDLAAALTGTEGKEWTLFLHQNAYLAKVQQRFFKGAPPKKQPITPLSSASFAKQDAGQFANCTMTEYLSILGMV